MTCRESAAGGGWIPECFWYLHGVYAPTCLKYQYLITGIFKGRWRGLPMVLLVVPLVCGVYYRPWLLCHTMSIKFMACVGKVEPM